jgi:uncharacterized DUF497 family protein
VFIEFDPAKDARNQKRHGLSLMVAESFDWASEPVVAAKTVRGEPRSKILAMVDGDLYAAIFVIRGARPRVISVRRASRRERREYAEIRKA